MRAAVARELDPELNPRPGLSSTNRLIVWIIILSSALAILATEPAIHTGREAMVQVLEYGILAIFVVEYVARVWSSIENSRYSGRLSYMVRPDALLDLAVIGVIALSFAGFEGVVLRLLRLGRLLRLAKLGRYSSALRTIGEAIAVRRFELIVSLAIASVLLLVSASALYVLEAEHQPDAFGSIPRAMWWSIATLTTVGYGDVVPITPLGRVFAAVTALTGIGLIAMPAGILASAFSDALQRRRDDQGNGEPG